MRNQTVDDALLDRMYETLRYAQIGQSVNSVTHDVNNSLGAIMAYSELVSMEPNLSEDAQRMLGEVVQAVRKASQQLGNLTDIARPERSDVREATPAELAERTAELRRHDLKVARAKLETDVEEGLPVMRVDLPRLVHALAALMTNAIEALPEGDGGKVRLAVRRAGEDRVAFAFWNTGMPVPAETREAMFAPLFTTKSGAHIGLGLSYAERLAAYHGGSVRYDDELGFVMEIPVRGAFAG